MPLFRQAKLRSKYQHADSFYGKTLVVLSLLAIIPYLLVIYLIIAEGIDITDRVVIISALALIFILIGYTLLRKAADNLVNLATETSRLAEAFEQGKPVEIDADKEVNEIAHHFNAILSKLQQENREIKEQSVQLMIYARDLSRSYKRSKEEEQIRFRLSRYVDQNLVEKLVNTGDTVFSDNERREVTVLFADIRSFTAISEKHEAEYVVSMLNEYFGAMAGIIFSHSGVLDKLVGDQIMAVFGVIGGDDAGAVEAVRTAIEMQKAIDGIMRDREARGMQIYSIGIGINTGAAIVGNVGTEHRMDYTVIGDCVNVASRLQQISMGGEITIGECTWERVADRFLVRERGAVQLKNRSVPVKCYVIEGER